MFLAFIGEAFQILDVDPFDRPRHQLDVADHADAIRAIRLGAATHRQLLARVSQFALQPLALIEQRSETRGHLVERRLHFGRDILGETRGVVRHLARRLAGDRLEAPHAGRNA